MPGQAGHTCILCCSMFAAPPHTQTNYIVAHQQMIWGANMTLTLEAKHSHGGSHPLIALSTKNWSNLVSNIMGGVLSATPFDAFYEAAAEEGL